MAPSLPAPPCRSCNGLVLGALSKRSWYRSASALPAREPGADRVAWRLLFAAPKESVFRRLANSGDCTLEASAETFSHITADEQNATTAYMTGKLKIKGDMGAAMKLQKIF